MEKTAEIILLGESKRKKREIYQRIKEMLEKYIWRDIYKEDFHQSGMDLCGIWTENQGGKFFLHGETECKGEILLQSVNLLQNIQKEQWLVYESKLKDLEEEIALYHELLQEYEKNQNKASQYKKSILQTWIKQKEKIVAEIYKDIFDEEKEMQLCEEICFKAECFLENKDIAYKND